MNLQVIADFRGDILWVSGALPGSVRQEGRVDVGRPGRTGGRRAGHPRQGLPGEHVREDPVQREEQAGFPTRRLVTPTRSTNRARRLRLVRRDRLGLGITASWRVVSIRCEPLDRSWTHRSPESTPRQRADPALSTANMASKAPHTTKKSPTFIRATTPAAMSIATTAIVITSFRPVRSTPVVSESATCQAHTRGPRPSSGVAKVLLIALCQRRTGPRLPIPRGGLSRPDQAEGGSDLPICARPHV